MTVGQRIAQKRKELGLSQEALGEQLGVSRQAIYKWESDATLPEIEKLISLSRIFSVSVGWLLGEESEETAGEDKELTEEQLRMVEEIVGRYLAAQPKAEPPKRRRWPWVVLVIAAVAVVVVFVNLFERMDNLSSKYSSLQNSISNINSSVSNQIGNITSRVEEILHAQNELTAEWTTEVKFMDIPANTVTFHVRVVPKTYREGMTALLVARSEGETTEVSVKIGAGNAFEGDITCNLTDNIDLTVVFVTDGQRETQVLQQYKYLYTNTFPAVVLIGTLWMNERDGVLPAGKEMADWVLDVYEDNESLWRAKAVDVKIGLFKDQKLVMWYTEEMQLVIVNGEQQLRPFYVWDQDVVLEPGSLYCEAAVITDEYGRVSVHADTPIEYKDGDWSIVRSWNSGPLAPEDWEY